MSCFHDMPSAEPEVDTIATIELLDVGVYVLDLVAAKEGAESWRTILSVASDSVTLGLSFRKSMTLLYDVPVVFVNVNVW